MSKDKVVYYCSSCGAQSPKWLGKCPSCGEWNTYHEEIVKKTKSGTIISFQTNKPQPITDIEILPQQRISTSNSELDRVLGGGLVSGSMVLIGGEPGIGKSTLLLQVALKMAKYKILYVSGEESEQQIKMRAERIGFAHAGCYIINETLTQNILYHIEQLNPDVIIIDSIQTLTTSTIDSSAGSISQVRETASELQRFAKQSSVPVILIGHITKDGSLAGPKLLEHMVDAVLQFEGDINYGYRILRTIKNRFGSTSELGIFEMNDKGLREVSNPSELLLSHRDEAYSGIAVGSAIEGLRPMLIEVQALVSSSVYGTPQRSATGFDLRRLSMLLAVLEKRCGFRLSSKDVFLNIAGGIRVDDPAIDLAVVSAILSSAEDVAIAQQCCFAAEVGLSGEIRPVSRIVQRIGEADKLGFEKIIVSKFNSKEIDCKNLSIEVISVSKIEELYKKLFEKTY